MIISSGNAEIVATGTAISYLGTPIKITLPYYDPSTKEHFEVSFGFGQNPEYGPNDIRTEPGKFMIYNINGEAYNTEPFTLIRFYDRELAVNFRAVKNQFQDILTYTFYLFDYVE